MIKTATCTTQTGQMTCNLPTPAAGPIQKPAPDCSGPTWRMNAMGAHRPLHTVGIFAMLFCLTVAQPAPAQEATPSELEKEWDALMGNEGAATGQRGQRSRRARTQNRADRQRQLPGGRERGIGGGRGWRGFMQPEELMQFLAEHEPRLAERMQSLRENSPERFQRYTTDLGRLYGPIVAQLEYNPEMGQISLKKVRIQLRVKWQVRRVKRESDAEKQAQFRARLHASVGELFDTIIEQEELSLRQFQENRRGFGSGQGDRGPGGGGPRGNRRPPGPQQFRQDRIDEHQQNLELWKAHRDAVVDSQVEMLLKGVTPFPWGR